MIFYFSGTGNSYQAARAVLSTGEQLIDAAECVRQGAFSFSPAPEEAVGFVCPVYYGGLPSVMREFIAGLQLAEKSAYCYGLLTCGGSPQAAGDMLRADLEKVGVTLDAFYTVKMPENYVVMFSPDSEEKIRRTLSSAERELARIKKSVDARERRPVKCSAADRLLTGSMYPLYGMMRRTKKFYADDQCIGCGTCARRCPAQAIVMRNGRPKWIKERCIHCMACVRCGAVQYGKTTVGKTRYTNPILKKASRHSHH